LLPWSCGELGWSPPLNWREMVVLEAGERAGELTEQELCTLLHG
jgi:hypothetical protein